MTSTEVKKQSLIEVESERVAGLLEKQDEILSRLQFISQIKANCKLQLDPTLRLMPDNWYNSLVRTVWWDDNRSCTLSFSRASIKDAFSLLEVLQESSKRSDRNTCERIIELLKAAKNGLECTKILYRDDVKLGCDLDQIALYIDSRLLDMTDPERVALVIEAAVHPVEVVVKPKQAAVEVVVKPKQAAVEVIKPKQAAVEAAVEVAVEAAVEVIKPKQAAVEATETTVEATETTVEAVEVPRSAPIPIPLSRREQRLAAAAAR
jgi:hypothetical protein